MKVNVFIAAKESHRAFTSVVKMTDYEVQFSWAFSSVLPNILNNNTPEPRAPEVVQLINYYQCGTYLASF